MPRGLTVAARRELAGMIQINFPSQATLTDSRVLSQAKPDG